MSKRDAVQYPEGFVDPSLPSGTFSHSQYSLYRKCGRAYEFRYVKKEVTPAAGAMRRGVLIHAGVEHALRHRMTHGTLPPVDSSIAAAKQEHDAYDGEVDWGSEPEGQVLDRAAQALRVYYKQGLQTVNPIAVEAPLLFKVGSVPVVGFIDFIDHPVGEPLPWVVDLKTSSKKWSSAMVALNTQLTLYAIGTQTPNVRIDNIVLKESGIDFQREENTRTRHQLKVLEEDIQEVASDIKRGRFPMAPIDSWACSASWCAYWAKCRGREY